MKREEKVTILRSRDDILQDLVERSVYLVDDDVIHIDFGDGKSIEFKANAMFVAMTHLLLDEKGEDYGTDD